MLDFTNVTREIRSLVSRRRELLTFLGTVFAAMGLFLQNVLQENLPPPYLKVKEHGFAYYAFLLMVPSLILALRLARLNAGLTLNGILYQRLMQEQNFTRKGSYESMRRAGKLNVFGVGFLMSLLTDFIAGAALALLVRALGGRPEASALAGFGVVVLWVLLYLYFHYRAVRFALRKAATDTCLPFGREDWEAHQAGSLEDGNLDMITILALVGLIVFSAFEGLSGLGRLGTSEQPDLSLQNVQEFGPEIYGALMTVTCLLGMTTYIRLRVAIGQRSLDLDPTDRPFRPLRLTDSLLGYMLLAFLFVVSLHFLLFAVLHEQLEILLVIDAAAFSAAILVEQMALVLAGRRRHAHPALPVSVEEKQAELEVPREPES